MVRDGRVSVPSGTLFPPMSRRQHCVGEWPGHAQRYGWPNGCMGGTRPPQADTSVRRSHTSPHFFFFRARPSRALFPRRLPRPTPAHTLRTQSRFPLFSAPMPPTVPSHEEAYKALPAGALDGLSPE